MSAFCDEVAQMARAMRNFLHAVDVRADLSIGDAVSMLSAWHGEDAPVMAMAHAADARADEDPVEARFWMNVYDALSHPHDSVGCHDALTRH